MLLRMVLAWMLSISFASAQTLLPFSSGAGSSSGGGNTPTFVQGVGSDLNDNNGITGNGFVFSLPNTTLSGNALILSVSYPFNAARTVAISDSCGDTWPAATITTGTASTGNMNSKTFVLANASACAHSLTVTLDTSVKPFHYAVAEFYNVATSSAADGSHGAANVACSAGAAGSYTPSTNNDANGGHLIWTYSISNDTVGTLLATQASAIAHTGGVSPLFMHANNVSTIPQASTFDVQTTNGAINPSINMTQSSGTNCVVSSVAIKAASAGTAPAAGIRVARVLHYTFVNPQNGSNFFLFPSQGNLLVVTLAANDGINPINSVTDSNGQTYTARAISGNSQLFDKQNASSGDALVVNINFNGVGQQDSTRFFDVVGAQTSSFLTTTGFNGASPSSGNVTTTGIPIITPSAAPGLVIDVTGWGTGPTTPPVAAPAGAFYDIVFYTGMTDQDRMDNADGTGHFYFSTTTTQTWNWNYANAARNSTLFATAAAYH